MMTRGRLAQIAVMCVGAWIVDGRVLCARVLKMRETGVGEGAAGVGARKEKEWKRKAEEAKLKLLRESLGLEVEW